MTRPADIDNPSTILPGEGSQSRRELRRRRLVEEAAAGRITPSSIFDLEVLPRAEKSASAAKVSTVQDSGLATAQPQATPGRASLEGATQPSVAKPVPLTASAPRPAKGKPVGLQSPLAPLKKVTSAPAAPAPVASPSKTVEPNPILLDRIPVVTSDTDSEVVDEAVTLPSTVSPALKRRGKFSTFAAIAGVAGMVLTMALPAFNFSWSDSASAEDIQGLASTSNSATAINLEKFESVDELEAAADAATRLDNSFVNNPNAEVQYPFASGVPLTDGFGPRSWPVAGFHDAQDFAAGYGAAVRSIAAGTVLESGMANDGCGYGLKIQHRIAGQDVTSRYCHLAANPVVAVGDKVAVGQFVALVGSTGISTGPHLHFVINVNGTAVDPMPYLAKYNR